MSQSNPTLDRAILPPPPASSPAPHAAGRLADWLTPKRARRYPAVFTLGVACFYVLSALKLDRMRELPLHLAVGRDFSAFYTGARFFMEGRINSLYNLAAQKGFQVALSAPIPTEHWAPFINPPFAVLLYAPFSNGSYPQSVLLWLAAGLLMLAASLFLLRRELLPGMHSTESRLILPLSFLFFPTLAWFLYGQSTALSLLIFTLAFIGLRRGRDFGAGAALGLLLIKPQLMLALGVVLVLKGRWRALLGAALSSSAWIGLGLALSPAVMGQYLRISPLLFDLLRREDYPAWGIHSFFGFSLLLFDGFSRPLTDIATALLTAGGVMALAAVWIRREWRPGSRGWDFAMASTFTLGLLISPQLYLYDLMLLLLPLAILWGLFPHGTHGRALDGGVLLTGTALLYVVTFVGSYASMGQLHLAAALGLPRMALQFSVPVIAWWAWLLARQAESPAPIRDALPIGLRARL